MTAPGMALARDKTSATTTMTNEVEVNFALNLPAVNRIVTALTDGDLYEPPEEKPTGKAILCAAKILGALGKEESASAEIEPFAGELSLIWRANGTKRVKAMFGPDGSYSVYHEQLTARRVTEHHLQSGANVEYLRDRLAWLKS